MSLIRFIIKKAVPLPRIEEMENFLFIGPHPDDIEIGAGATAAKLAAMGKKVTFLICTDGRYGDGYTDLRGDAVMQLREEESRRSAELLGIRDLRFLRYSDGGFYDREDLRRSIASVISEVQPDMIFCPDPDVTSECHPDHLNVGRIGKDLAFCSSNESIMGKMGLAAAPLKAVGFYYSANCNSFVDTTGYLDKQLASLFTCHVSQFPAGSGDASSIRTYLNVRGRIYGLRRFCSTAEGFRVLGRTHMHCLPEAGN